MNKKGSLKKVKPVIGIFDLTDCNGCLWAFANHPDFLNILKMVKVKSFRLASEGKLRGHYDISIVEGYPGDEEEVEILKRIRENSDTLIALGACACTGGIQTIRNFLKLDEVKNYVYPDSTSIKLVEAKPIDAYVKVDFYIPGCPVNGREVVEALKALILGKTPEIPNYAVCVECKIRETECMLVNGLPCLGPVTRGGCNAPCPAAGYICDGCRGPLKEANFASEAEILKQIIKKKDLTLLFRRYASLMEGFRGIAEGEV